MARPLLAACALAVCALAASAQVVFDVDAGSASADADDLFSGTTAHKYAVVPTPPIANTDDDVRFASHRSALKGAPFSYTFPGLAAGAYDVTLGFAETWAPNCVAGGRVFSVVVNGAPALTDFDAFVEAGACNAAVLRTVTVDVPDDDGSIALDFSSVGGAENAFVSSIVIDGPGAGGATTGPTTSAVTTVDASTAAATTPAASTAGATTVDATTAVGATTDGATTAVTTVSAATTSPVTSDVATTPSVTSDALTTLPVSSTVVTTLGVTSAAETTIAVTTVAPPDGAVVVDIDAGSGSDNGDLVTGINSQKYSVSSAIAGTDDDARFASHRFGNSFSSFTFTLPDLEAGTYALTLGFAEVWPPACNPGVRVFSVSVNGEAVLEDLDVFSLAGCQAAHTETLTVDVAAAGDSLAIEFAPSGGSENAFVSSIVLTEGTVGTTTVGTGTTTTAPLGNVTTTTSIVGDSVISVNAGGGTGDDADAVTGTSFTFSQTNKPVGGTEEDAIFQSHRYGPEFSYTFNVPSGIYAIALGFNENANINCNNASRVFSVELNDEPINALFSSIDVFKEAGGCDIALVRTVRLQVDGELKLSFIAISNNAFVSTIDISSVTGCGAADGNNGGEDHRAHSVPGTYPEQANADSPKSYIDIDGDGFETVTIDGFRSHTHFQDISDPDNPVSGFIAEYKWTNLDTGVVLSNEQSFTQDFPLGTTRLSLEVVDSTCDRSEAETSVTVTGAVSPGAYCYYYNTETALVGVGLEAETEKPLFAYERVEDFSGAIESPPDFGDGVYAVRCRFLYQVDSDSEVTQLSIDTSGTGSAQVYKGADLILDTEDTPATEIPMSTGLTKFEVVYLRTDVSSTPSLSMSVNGTDISVDDISYDRSTVVPVLTEVNPGTAPAGGGVDVLISGYGFYAVPTANFGGSSVTAQDDFLPTSFSVTTPSGVDGAVKLSVENSVNGLSSNELDFSFGGDVDPILFSQETVTETSGADAKSNLATCITVWGDTWYLGSLFGRVQKLVVSPELVVQSRCESEQLQDPTIVSSSGDLARSDVLGMAISPTDTVGMPYVSVQTLYWFYSNRVDPSNQEVWRNGRIVRLVDDATCLAIDEVVVSGLPVSDHDHGVNGMEFDNNGDLFVAVGGATNGGLASSQFGFFWETPLSAAILRVKLSLGADFNGQVEYDREYEDHQNAIQTAGDVETFATGLRNSFNLVFTSEEKFFATDNGPNGNFGLFSTECDQNVTDGVDDFSRPDKIVEVEEGDWFGHPNLNRGECQYIDPFTGQDLASPARDPLPELNYKEQLETVPSSVNGIIEYTASHFGSALKGELIASAYAPQSVGTVYRKKLGGDLQTLDNSWGGLSVAQGVFGELIFPRVGFSANNIQVLQPDYPFPTGLSARVVTPFRGGSAGGLVVTITGHGFDAGTPTVTFNDNPCPVVAGSVIETSRGSLLKCTTPANTGGAQLVDVTVSVGDDSSVITDAFMYSAAA